MKHLIFDVVIIIFIVFYYFYCNSFWSVVIFCFILCRISCFKNLTILPIPKLLFNKVLSRVKFLLIVAFVNHGTYMAQRRDGLAITVRHTGEIDALLDLLFGFLLLLFLIVINEKVFFLFVLRLFLYDFRLLWMCSVSSIHIFHCISKQTLSFCLAVNDFGWIIRFKMYFPSADFFVALFFNKVIVFVHNKLNYN